MGWARVELGDHTLGQVIGGVVVLVKLLTPAGAPAATGVGHVILTVLAVIGGVALVAFLAMGTMHFGMMR